MSPARFDIMHRLLVSRGQPTWSGNFPSFGRSSSGTTILHRRCLHFPFSQAWTRLYHLLFTCPWRSIHVPWPRIFANGNYIQFDWWALLFSWVTRVINDWLNHVLKKSWWHCDIFNDVECFFVIIVWHEDIERTLQNTVDDAMTGHYGSSSLYFLSLNSCDIHQPSGWCVCFHDVLKGWQIQYSLGDSYRCCNTFSARVLLSSLLFQWLNPCAIRYGDYERERMLYEQLQLWMMSPRADQRQNYWRYKIML